VEQGKIFRSPEKFGLRRHLVLHGLRQPIPALASGPQLEFDL
jgi:hypothetical protein